MTRVWTIRAATLLMAGLVLCGGVADAVAQVTLPPRPAPTQSASDDEGRPPYSPWHLGVTSGITDVARTDSLAAMDLGIRLRRNLHVAFEAGRMFDVVTQRRIDESQTYVDFVQSAYGLPASGTMRGNAWYGLVGFRFIPDGAAWGEGNGIRPYVQASAGLARVEYNPRYVVNGQEISGAALQIYGVTLGKDLLGTTNRFMYSGGAGLVFGSTWYLDLGVRFTRINTTDHPTDVKRFVIGMGRRF